MPKAAEREIKRRGGVKRWRTIKRDGKTLRCAITRREGKRGGDTVCYEIAGKKKRRGSRKKK